MTEANIRDFEEGDSIVVEYNSAFGWMNTVSGVVTEARPGGASLYHVWFTADDGTEYRLTELISMTLSKENRKGTRRLSTKGGVESIERS